MQPAARLALPLASLTAVGMLASDLYLPALPAMRGQLMASIPMAQATMAVFMLSLAVSQLAWGWVADRYGDRFSIVLGTLLLAAGSVLCALSEYIFPMLAGRLFQGLGAGAAAVAVPALIRRHYAETDAVKALAVVAMAESVIPAVGPVLGAAIVLHGSWRITFWVIAAAALLLLPLVSRIVPRGAPATLAAPSHHGTLLRNVTFLRHALSYALMFGALMMFVASAPHLVTHWLGKDVASFALLQVCSVIFFMIGAALGAKGVKQTGTGQIIRRGMMLQLISSGMLVACALYEPHLVLLLTAWSLFCFGLGVRGPATFGRALSLGGARAGTAAGLVMFLAFGVSSMSTIAVAPLLGQGLVPVALGMLAMVIASMVAIPEAFRAQATLQHAKSP